MMGEGYTRRRVTRSVRRQRGAENVIYVAIVSVIVASFSLLFLVAIVAQLIRGGE